MGMFETLESRALRSFSGPIVSRGVVFLLAALWAVPAGAVINPIGPFVGVYSETWESFPRYLPSQTYLPNPSDIMGGFASISSPLMGVYQPTAGDFISLSSNGFAKTSDGVKAMWLDSTPATATITFDAPIGSFGAYWSASSAFF